MCRIQNRWVPIKEWRIFKQTSLSWFWLSFRHNSTAKGSCRGLLYNLLCSIGLRLFHSLTKYTRAGLYIKSSLIHLRASFLLSWFRESFVSSSSGRKFLNRGVGLASTPRIHEYKWILPVYLLTWKRLNWLKTVSDIQWWQLIFISELDRQLCCTGPHVVVVPNSHINSSKNQLDELHYKLGWDEIMLNLEKNHIYWSKYTNTAWRMYIKTYPSLSKKEPLCGGPRRYLGVHNIALDH